ncbi:MAG: preprotein translocase subunit SecG [Gemmatimonas sp.]|nr:preprotein translocase subunit SecG [Gemmatimonadaceae bacterium]
MLYNILLVLLIIDSLVLIVAVLLQAGQGGGMAASFGGVSSSASSFMGARQAGNLLTKASWWCGGLFLGLSFLLALASTRSRTPPSVLDQTFQTPVTAPASPAPNPAAANPAIPLAPAPNAATTTQPGQGAKAPATGTKQPAEKAPPATKKP